MITILSINNHDDDRWWYHLNSDNFDPQTIVSSPSKPAQIHRRPCLWRKTIWALAGLILIIDIYITSRYDQSNTILDRCLIYDHSLIFLIQPFWSLPHNNHHHCTDDNLGPKQTWAALGQLELLCTLWVTNSHQILLKLKTDSANLDLTLLSPQQWIRMFLPKGRLQPPTKSSTGVEEYDQSLSA